MSLSIPLNSSLPQGAKRLYSEVDRNEAIALKFIHIVDERIGALREEIFQQFSELQNQSCTEPIVAMAWKFIRISRKERYVDKNYRELILGFVEKYAK